MTSQASSQGPRTTSTRWLDPDEVPAVIALTRAAGVADGVAPLSEPVLLRLRPSDSEPALHLMVHDPNGALLGYAHLHPGTDGASAELVVHPTHRRRGIGRALLAATIEATRNRQLAPDDTADRAADGTADQAADDAVDRAADDTVDRAADDTVDRAAPGRRLHVWAHGDHPSAAALALDLGFERTRVLWQLRRPLTEPLPDPRFPAGVSVRAFRPGADDDAWLAVNRRAFAEHPEQGRWTPEDLRVRMTEPWFDPGGFLLAIDDSTGRILGFHWTKVHGGQPAGTVRPESPIEPSELGHRGEPIGEVYVLGVDPATHGLGLGRALTLAGLRHLRDRGLTRAMLYVDESNSAAVALYTGLGFGHWASDVNYQRRM